MTTHQDFVSLYQKHIHNTVKHSMKYSAKIVNGWIQSTIFAEKSILDVSLGSEYVSDYPEALSIIINWQFNFEFSWMFLIWLVFYLSISSRRFPWVTIKLCLKPVRTSPWRTRKAFTYLLFFLFNNLEHAHNWVGCFC